MIIRYLRKLGRLYTILQGVYYAGLYLCERYVLGTRVHELLWRVRWFDQSGGCGDCDSHRAFLAECVGRFSPFRSILEVGCGAAGNLVVLARAYPGTRLYGVDVSAEAVKAATTVLKREAIAEATVSIGRANDLRLFSDNSLDVVLTDAALMYVGPDKISHVISELTRVARKGLILNEWHLFQTDKGEPSSYWYYAHWVHNYTRLLGCAPRVKSFRIERLPAGLWNTGGGWEAFGAVIEVQL